MPVSSKSSKVKVNTFIEILFSASEQLSRNTRSNAIENGGIPGDYS